MATPYMLLDLPVPLMTLGPLWASEIITAFDKVDAHDHTSGKGKPIVSAALSIDADVDWHSNNIYSVRAIGFTNQGFVVVNPGTLSEFGGDLYYANDAGTPIQITNGSSIVSADSYFVDTNVSSNIVIAPSDAFTYLRVNTTAARTITFPAANLVTAGRQYWIKDITGSAATNNITLIRSGSDKFDGVSANRVLAAAYESVMVKSNGVDGWDLVYGATQNILQGIFGTPATTTQFIGNTISIAAQGSNTVTIGDTNNVINIEGDEFNWQSHVNFNVTASDMTFLVSDDVSWTVTGDFIVSSAGNISLLCGSGSGSAVGDWSFGNSGDTFTVAGPATLSNTLHVVGDLTSNGVNTWTNQQTYSGSLFMNGGVVMTENVFIGTASSDNFNISSTSSFDGPLFVNNTATFDTTASFLGNVNLGNSLADTVTVNAVTNFVTGFSVLAGTSNFKNVSIDDNTTIGSSNGDSLTVNAQLINGLISSSNGYYSGRHLIRYSYVTGAVNNSTSYSPAAGLDHVIAVSAAGTFTWTIPVSGALNGDMITFVNQTGVSMVLNTAGGGPNVDTTSTSGPVRAIYDASLGYWRKA